MLSLRFIYSDFKSSRICYVAGAVHLPVYTGRPIPRARPCFLMFVDCHVRQLSTSPDIYLRCQVYFVASILGKENKSLKKKKFEVMESGNFEGTWSQVACLFEVTVTLEGQ